MRVDRIPRSCQKLYRSREEAEAAGQAGSLDLRLCKGCGLVWNRAFREEAGEPVFDADYYCSFASSEEGRRTQEMTAEQLHHRVDVRGKTVLEIGCGDGYFLSRLQQFGASCIGYEPSSTYQAAAARPGLTIFREPYDFEGSDDSRQEAEVVVMRHVLEHLPNPRQILRSLRHQRSRGGGARYLYVEVPNLTALLKQALYFDFYYDHVVYFSEAALRRLLALEGWSPMASLAGRDEFIGLLCCAEEAALPSERGEWPGDTRNQEDIVAASDRFREGFVRWQQDVLGMLEKINRQGQRTAVWGAGSRGVALLNWIGRSEGLIAYVVDSDPHKQGLFAPGIPGSIESPERLHTHPVEHVMVSSFTYFYEIAAGLRWFLRQGGHLIQPYPTPRFVERLDG